MTLHERDLKGWKKNLRPQKYGNVGFRTDDGYFASKREYARWRALKILVMAGEVRELKRQVRYALTVNGMKVATYIADFTYTDATGFVVEDAKGCVTPEYELKRALFEAIFGFKIKET